MEPNCWNRPARSVWKALSPSSRDQPYRSGRTGDWLKIKCIQSESFMIVGYEASAAARGGIGSLLLAGEAGDDWIYVGSVGTGFSGKDAAFLRTALDKLKTKTPTVR